MILATTFKLLREQNACTSGYRKLAKYLGGIKKYGENTAIDLLTILESNGFDDTVWCLRATIESSDSTKRLIAADFAESVLHIFESKRPGDDRPRKAIQAARDFANGLISDVELRKAAAYADAAAADAAYAAAAAAAAYAAAAAAAYAAYAAADVAYAAAAADVAYAARKKHRYGILTEILKRHLS